MPADTMQYMILGFSVIIGVLVMYTLILAGRIHAAKKQYEQHRQE